MKKRIILVLIAAMVLVAVLLCGAALESGNAFAAENVSEAEDIAKTPEEKEEAVPTQNIQKCDYSFLKGTRYKNLYATKYPNLIETMKVEEPVAETPAGNASGAVGGNWQQNIGSAQNPGYSGGAGSYSLQDKTVAAHLTVQGTSIQDKAIWQCSTSTNYYEPSSVAWAAKTAHLRSGELSQNTVIYGHNWNNCFVPFKKTGSQFESLMAYTYEDFVAENQYIYLTTNGGTHTFQVFAVCFTTDLNFYINCNNIDVSTVASKAMGMSLFDFGVSVGSSDKIITLSTCTRYFKGLGANQRFIIMGKLISTE